MTPQMPTLSLPARRYCRSCGYDKPLEGGVIVVPKSNSRSASRYWRCRTCNERRTEGGEKR